MKRIVCVFLVLAAVLSAGTLTACRGDISREVRFWTYDMPEGERTDYSRIIEDFTAETGIKVNVSYVPRDKYSERLKSAVERGEAPDVCVTEFSDIADAAASGMIAPLNDRLRLSGIKGDKTMEAARRACAFQAKTYGVPYAVSGDILLYNKNKVPQDKIPATQDELMSGEFKLAVKDRGEAFVGLLYALGGKLVDKDGVTPAFASDEGKKAAEVLQKTQSENLDAEDFAAGKAELLIATQREFKQLSEQVSDFVVGAAVLPGGGEHIIGGDALCLLSSAEKKSNAFLLIDYLGQEPRLKRVAAVTGSVSALKKQTGENEAATALLRMAEDAQTAPPTEGMTKVREQCVYPMADEVSRGADIASALKAAAERAQKIIKGE